MCELGFNIFLHPRWVGVGIGLGLVLGGSSEDMVENCPFFWCFMVIIMVWWGGLLQ
jgi:hypothetical protein